MLKAVTDDKLSTVNILCRYLSLIETLHKKQTNEAVEVSLGTNVEQSILFQIALKNSIAPENLQIFHFY